MNSFSEEVMAVFNGWKDKRVQGNAQIRDTL
jgi:hypothetical protein